VSVPVPGGGDGDGEQEEADDCWKAQIYHASDVFLSGHIFSLALTGHDKTLSFGGLFFVGS